MICESKALVSHSSQDILMLTSHWPSFTIIISHFHFSENLIPLFLVHLRFISPCRSLCESVRESCAPIMGCYGYPWPEILRCDQYPSDHLMCISSITNSSAQTGRQRGDQLTREIRTLTWNSKVYWLPFFWLSASSKLPGLCTGRGVVL